MGVRLEDLPDRIRDKVRQAEKGRPDAARKLIQTDKSVKANPYYKRGSAIGKMNKTERDFNTYLESLRRSGEVLDYWYEPMNLRLADNTYFRPDFMVLESGGTISLIDVKGYWTDKARIKNKIAADRYYLFQFRAAKKTKSGSGWDFENFN